MRYDVIYFFQDYEFILFYLLIDGSFLSQTLILIKIFTQSAIFNIITTLNFQTTSLTTTHFTFRLVVYDTMVNTHLLNIFFNFRFVLFFLNCVNSNYCRKNLFARKRDKYRQSHICVCSSRDYLKKQTMVIRLRERVCVCE